MIAFRRRDERERDAGVARSRLDDDSFFFQNATSFGVLDHRHADAILDAAERIEKFALEQDGRARAGGDLVQFDERRAADGFDDVVVDVSHKIYWLIIYLQRLWLNSNRRQAFFIAAAGDFSQDFV